MKQNTEEDDYYGIDDNTPELSDQEILEQQIEIDNHMEMGEDDVEFI